MDDEEEDVYFSLPPSPVLRPNATFDAHLRDLEMDSLELPSLSGMETDMFTDSSDSDDDSVMGSPVHTAMWVLRETRVLPDLEEDDVAVVVPGNEVEESGIIATADSRFGSLVCLIDRWSCADDPPPPPDPVLAESMSCDSDIWYDAMDTEDSFSHPSSLGNIQMACDGTSFAIWDELLASTTPSRSSGMPGAFGIACPLGNPQRLDDIFCNVATTPLTTIDYSSFVSCSFRLTEDDLSLAMLQDVSSLDLIDLSVSRVPTPVPSPALPGAWWESLESVDDFLL